MEVPIPENAFTLDDLVNLLRKVFMRMANTYGGYTTLNELLIAHYLTVCEVDQRPCTVTGASEDLGLTKSTVSRIFTGMRARKLITEDGDEGDRRKRFFRKTVEYDLQLKEDLHDILLWVNAERVVDRLKGDTIRTSNLLIREKLRFGRRKDDEAE